jgi:hypothetical protein
MANTVEGSGTQTAVINTEHTLHTNAGAKNFVLIVNTENLLNDEILELRIKTKVISTSTADEVYVATYNHAQGQKVKYSPPVPATGQTAGTSFTLKQTARVPNCRGRGGSRDG